MNKRLLFCVETTRQADTDYAYIKETIRHYYEETGDRGRFETTEKVRAT